MNHQTQALIPAGILVALLLLCGWAPAVAAPPVGASPQGVIEGHYIVVLRPDAGDPASAARELGRAHRFEVDFVYSHALRGFSARMSPAAVEALQRSPRVHYIEPDRTVRIMSQTVPTGIERIFAPGNPALGIDGVDDRRVDMDVAVLDTGIDASHPDLDVVARIDCSGGNPNRGSCKAGGDDGNGHGTHVAGTIAAIDNGIGVVGVAPGARLWAVKVLDNQGSGYLSWIIAGIDWVTARAVTIRVANMSLGCECSSRALDEAITNSAGAGVTYAVSAGNSGKDAATFSPANHPDVITVSALADFDGMPGGIGAPTCRLDQDDTLANFSNYGAVIDLAAPGVCILSTWPGGSYRSLSGTSMAAPHVAGAAVVLASSGITGPAQVRAALVQAGNNGWIDTSGDGLQEPLLDVGDGALFAPATVAGTDPGPGEPVATVTINSPANGDVFLVGDGILFAGEADDGEGGDLSSALKWISNLEGEIGTGASIVAPLGAGEHTITALIEEPAAISTVNITVREVGAAPALRVESIAYTTSGGRGNDRHLTVVVKVADGDGKPVAGVSVVVEIKNTTTGASWHATATTGSNGTASFGINNHAAGCYATEVLSLDSEAPGAYDDPGYCK